MNIRRILIIGGIITFIGIIIAIIVLVSSKKTISPPLNPEQDTCKKSCKNGNCTISGICICNPGYQSDNCDTQTPIDLCKNINCGFHGSCIDGLCKCIDGYTGTLCQIEPDICKNIDCGTNGQCLQGQCLCNSGWTGDKCQTQVNLEVFIVLSKDPTKYTINIDDINKALKTLDNTGKTTMATYDQLQTAFNNGADWCVNGWINNNGLLNTAYPISITIKSDCAESPGVQLNTSPTSLTIAGITCYGLKPAKNSDQANKFTILPFNPVKWSQYDDSSFSQYDFAAIKSMCGDKWSSKDTTSFGLMSNVTKMPNDLKNQLITCPKSCGKFCQYFPDKSYIYIPSSGWNIASSSQCSISDSDYYDCNQKTNCLNNCSNKGTCDSLTGKCSCDSGYYEEDCSKKLCPNDGNCLNGGICNSLTGLCVCPSPSRFYGENCEKIKCQDGNCSGNGTCDVSTGNCTCTVGFTGDNCEKLNESFIVSYSNGYRLTTNTSTFDQVKTTYYNNPSNLDNYIDYFNNNTSGTQLSLGKYFYYEDINFDVQNFTLFVVFKGTFWMEFISPISYWGGGGDGLHFYELGGINAQIPGKPSNHHQVGFYIWSNPQIGSSLWAARQAWFANIQGIGDINNAYPIDRVVLMTVRVKDGDVSFYKNKTKVIDSVASQMGKGSTPQQGLLQINTRYGDGNLGWNCLLGLFELYKIPLSDEQINYIQNLLINYYGIID